MRSLLVLLALVMLTGCPGDKLGGIEDCETVVGTCPKGGGKSWWSTEADGCWVSATVQVGGKWISASSGIDLHESDDGFEVWGDAWIECPDGATAAQGILCDSCNPDTAHLPLSPVDTGDEEP